MRKAENNSWQRLLKILSIIMARQQIDFITHYAVNENIDNKFKMFNPQRKSKAADIFMQ